MGSNAQAEIREVRRLARKLSALAVGMARNGRFAVIDEDEKPAIVINDVQYYDSESVQTICCLAKSTLWDYRKRGVFPEPDLVMYRNTAHH